MKVVITGTTSGIGKAIAELFLQRGHEVHGIDILDASIAHENYTHHVADVSVPESLPELSGVQVLVNNAGIQDDTVKAVEVNMNGTVYCTEKYAFTPDIKSVVNVVSASAHNGAEFPWYTCSKGGMLAYSKHTAQELAKYGATCNSVSPGGVYTDINKHIIEDPALMQAVLDETMLGRWADPSEIAEWVYFLAVINKSATAQDILIDNGEMAKFNFVW